MASGKRLIELTVISEQSEKTTACCNDDHCSEKVRNEQDNPSEMPEPIVNGNIRIYQIEGMDCGSCAATIENHMRTSPFVASVKVNFSTGKMNIEHSSNPQDVIAEVAKVGYKASLASSNSRSIEQKKDRAGVNISVFSGVMLGLGYLGSFTGLPALISTILYAAAIAVAGYRPARSAVYAVRSRSLDMNVLMTTAAVGAALIGEWLEGAAVLWLFSVGNALQNRSIEKTRNSIRSLMDLTPPEAWVKTANGFVRTPVDDIGLGRIVTVKPGEKIPLDGIIVKGESSVNQAPITGESVPVDKGPGSSVFAGTLNESGAIEIRVTRPSDDSAVSRIIRLVEEAQDKKAPTEAFVDRFAKVYTPIVFIVALCTIVLPPLLGWGSWSEWFYRGLGLLVVACPCALVISTPVAIVSAIGNAARNGILIKGGTYLEKAGLIDAIAFDKTGTLTEGKPQVSHVEAYDFPEELLLSIARTIEEQTRHPIAQTIVAYAKSCGIDSKPGESFRTIAGKGAQATIDGTEYYAGKPRWFEEMSISSQESFKRAKELEQEGQTVVLVGSSQKTIGLIAVADAIRPISVGIMAKLKDSGICQVVMLTGDNEETARNISQKAKVERYFADMMPEDKVSAVKTLQQEGYQVAMVGDGINDAPALATSDLGIAMGGAGTDTAMETANIVLMADNLEKLPYMLRLSKKSLTIIKQNIIFSLLVKFVALALIFPGWLTLWLAVLSDTGAALLVILNSMRLLALKDK